MNNPLLSIIIVNWNAGKQLSDCLQSVYASTLIDFEVWVVDNHSSDESMTQLPPDTRLHVIQNVDNKGFAAACNQAIIRSQSAYLLLLNPDTRVEPDTLEQSIAYMQTHVEIGILGCRHINEHGQTQPSCSRFPTLAHYVNDITGLSKLMPKRFKPATVMTDWSFDKSGYVDQVMGAFFLFRQEVVQRTGLLDERFFVYLEDVDFAKRAATAGFDSYYNADITIFHKGGGTSEQVKARRLFYLLRSRLRYADKHFSRSSFLVLTGLTVLLEPVTRVVMLAGRGQWQDIRETLKSYGYLTRQLVNGQLLAN